MKDQKRLTDKVRKVLKASEDVSKAVLEYSKADRIMNDCLNRKETCLKELKIALGAKATVYVSIQGITYRIATTMLDPQSITIILG